MTTPVPNADRDRSKLPRWARDLLAKQEADLADLRDRLSAGPSDSDTYADPYADTPRPLGKSPCIRFGTPGTDQMLDAQFTDGILEIRGTTVSVSNTQLVVAPVSGNVARIYFASRKPL